MLSENSVSIFKLQKIDSKKMANANVKGIEKSGCGIPLSLDMIL